MTKNSDTMKEKNDKFDYEIYFCMTKEKQHKKLKRQQLG